MDGNRRYAKRRGLPAKFGHKEGLKTLTKLKNWCTNTTITELTIYAFSIQNFNRSKEEIDFLMNIFRKELTSMTKELNSTNDQLRYNFIGNLSLFPEDIQILCKNLIEKTKNNTKYTLNTCIGYGGREEIINATKQIAKQVSNGNITPDEINEQTILNNLYLSSSPDLIIRTSGEIRTSNFLPFQSTYSEWFFLEKTWPEFSKQDFENIIKKFHTRERRYGK